MNDFEIWQKAMKKINLTESAAPFVRGVMLVEDSEVEMYNKIQKLLNTRAMETSHPFLYNLDPLELSESEMNKVNNLYKLGVDRGFIEEEGQEDEESDVKECGDIEVAAVEEPNAFAVVTKAPVQPEIKAPKVNQNAYVILYSAMRNGQIKTGEAFSNSLDTRSAKADVISKLEKAGYQNISILAIEAGDPDMAGVSDEVNMSDDSTYDIPDYAAESESEQVNEWGRYETGLEKGRMSEPSDADMAAWNAQNAKANLPEYLKQNYIKTKNNIGPISPNTVKKFLNTNADKFKNALQKIEDATNKYNDTDKNFQPQLNEYLALINAYANGKITISNKAKFDELVLCVFNLITFIDEKSFLFGGLDNSINSYTPFYNYTLHLKNELKQLDGNIGEADDREPLSHAFDPIGVKASTANSKAQDAVSMTMISDDEELEEADDEESKDDSTEDDKSDDKTNDDSDEESKDDSEDSDDTESEDDEAEEKEEKAEEPDEKLKDDNEESDDEADDSDDKKDDEEKELSASEKESLRDSYKKAFKAAMLKCKFETSFSELSLEDKVKFFTELAKAWGKKADPSKFMSDKEIDQLEKIVVKK